MTETMYSTGELKCRDVKSPDMEDVQIAHLAGVFDVAGSVTVQVSKNNRYSIGYQYQPVVRFHRPANDDDPLMGKLMEYCDDLAVRYHISEKEHGAGRKPAYEFTVKDAESIKRFLEPMAPYFVVRYEPASLLLDVVIPAVKDDEHTTKEGFLRLMPAADTLRGGTSREVKYTTEYFEDEWGLDAEALLAE